LAPPDAFSSSFSVELAEHEELQDGPIVGHLELFEERLVETPYGVAYLARSPEAWVNVLEADGQGVLEKAGALLDERVPESIQAVAVCR
jgi:hypothetical protein